MNNIEFIRNLLTQNPQGLTGPEIRRALIKRNLASGRIPAYQAVKGLEGLVNYNYYGWYTMAPRDYLRSFQQLTPAERGYWVKRGGRWFLPEGVPRPLWAKRDDGRWEPT